MKRAKDRSYPCFLMKGVGMPTWSPTFIQADMKMMIIACNKCNLLHSCKLPKKHYSITLFHWCLLWVQRTLTWIITVLEPNGIKKKTCAPCTIRYLFIIHLSNYYRHLQTTAKQSNWTNIYSTDRYAHSLANDILMFLLGILSTYEKWKHNIFEQPPSGLSAAHISWVSRVRAPCKRESKNKSSSSSSSSSSWSSS